MGLFDYPDAESELQAAPPPEHEITILAELSEEDWARVLKLVEVRQFRQGEYLARVGEKDDALFILTAGEVEVLVDSTEGKTVIAVVPRGSVFGEVAFFDGEPRSATIRARSSGSAVRVTRENFERLAAWEPVIARQLLFDLGQVLANRLRRTTNLAFGRT